MNLKTWHVVEVALLCTAVFLTAANLWLARTPPAAKCPPTRAPTGYCDGKNGILDKAPGGIVNCFRGWV